MNPTPNNEVTTRLFHGCCLTVWESGQLLYEKEEGFLAAGSYVWVENDFCLELPCLSTAENSHLLQVCTSDMILSLHIKIQDAPYSSESAEEEFELGGQAGGEEEVGIFWKCKEWGQHPFWGKGSVLIFSRESRVGGL